RPRGRRHDVRARSPDEDARPRASRDPDRRKGRGGRSGGKRRGPGAQDAEALTPSGPPPGPLSETIATRGRVGHSNGRKSQANSRAGQKGGTHVSADWGIAGTEGVAPRPTCADGTTHW